MDYIKMYPIISNYIREIGYDGINLYLNTNKQGLIKFINVPKYLFEEMRNHKFPGAYFGSNIKNNYKEEKVK